MNHPLHLLLLLCLSPQVCVCVLSFMYVLDINEPLVLVLPSAVTSFPGGPSLLSLPQLWNWGRPTYLSSSLWTTYQLELVYITQSRCVQQGCNTSLLALWGVGLKVSFLIIWYQIDLMWFRQCDDGHLFYMKWILRIYKLTDSRHHLLLIRLKCDK